MLLKEFVEIIEKEMSLSSKAFLFTACSLTVGIVGFVHYKQQYDRDQLHLGVIRDLERQQRRKAENVYVLEQQIELTKALQKQNTAPPLRQLEEKT